jgi:hypothetical protein
VRIRARKCKVGATGCKGTYTPFNTLQKCCFNPACAVEVVRQAKVKGERRELLSYRVKTKPHGKWVQEAEFQVRRFVRARDAASNKPCISCGRHEYELGGDPRGGLWDAGHYLGKGAYPEHRFDVRQIHRQCKSCNRDKSGAPVEYRKGLIKRMGLEYVEWLEGPHPAKKYTIEQLKEIKQKYSKLANQLEKARAA